MDNKARKVRTVYYILHILFIDELNLIISHLLYFFNFCSHSHKIEIYQHFVLFLDNVFTLHTK